MLSYPLRIPSPTIEGRCCREGWVEIGDGARKSVLEKTIRINGRNEVLEAIWIGWNGGLRCWRRRCWRSLFF